MAATLDAFVSYSRHDGEFVTALARALEQRGRNVWIDADDIPAGAPWRSELGTGIEAADAFVYVISPDSVASEECAKELDRALALGKRLVPVLLRPADGVPEAVAAIQYIDVARDGGLNGTVEALDQAIRTDYEWVRAHTEWLARALRWEQGGRDRSLLLRGTELDAAERWLASGTDDKDPPPSPLQREYVAAGRRSERRRLRLVAGLSLAAVLVSLGFAVLALVARNEAIEQRDEATEQRNQALSRELAARAAAQLDADPQRSLRLALRAADTAPSAQAEAALQGALATSHLRLALATGSPSLDGEATPGGRYAVSVHADGRGRVWDLRSGRRLATLRGHTAPVSSVDVSGDGRLAVTASRVGPDGRDGSVRIWALPSGRPRGVLRHDANGISTAAFSPDGRRVVTTPFIDANAPATVWDVRSGERVRKLGAPDATSFATWSPDGTRIATIDDEIRIWDLRRRRPLSTIEVGADDFPVELAFSPDGRRLAAAGDGVGFVADVATGATTPLRGRNSFAHALTSVRFCPDGRCVVTGSVDGQVRIWSPSGRAIATLRGHSAEVTGASPSPDGRYVLTESEDGTARLWSRRSGAELAVLRGHDGDVTSARFLAGGRRILTGSSDGSARVWDPGVVVLDGHRDLVTDARFASDARSVATGSYDGVARLWSAGGELRTELKGEPFDPVESVLFAPDGRRLVTAQLAVWLWRPDGTEVKSVDVQWGDPAFSPDSKLVAAADSDAVVLFAAGDGRRVKTLPVGTPGDRQTAVFAPEFSPDGRLVAAAGALTGAHVWSVRGSRRSLDLRTRERIDEVAFEPGGGRLATAGDTARVVRIWTLDSRRSVVLDRYPTGVRALEFSREGGLIATVSAGERSVRVHDAESRRRVAVLRHENEVLDASFDPGGRLLLTVADESRAYLWDARSGRLVARLAGHADGLSAARFAPDGRSIVTASDDGTAIVHRCDECRPSDELVELARRRISGVAGGG